MVGLTKRTVYEVTGLWQTVLRSARLVKRLYMATKKHLYRAAGGELAALESVAFKGLWMMVWRSSLGGRCRFVLHAVRAAGEGWHGSGEGTMMTMVAWRMPGNCVHVPWNNQASDSDAEDSG